MILPFQKKSGNFKVNQPLIFRWCFFDAGFWPEASETNSLPLKMGRAPKGNEFSIPTIHFAGAKMLVSERVSSACFFSDWFFFSQKGNETVVMVESDQIST